MSANGRRVCKATTARGRPCSKTAKKDSEYCGSHAGNVGPRSKLTPDVRDELVRLIGAGAYNVTAARAVGIGQSTFYRWLETGEADVQHDVDSPERELWEAVEKAASDAEHRAIFIVLQAAQGRAAEYDDDGNLVRAERAPNWTAAMTFLERKFPDRWARMERREVSGPGGGAVTFAELMGIAESTDRDDADTPAD